LIAKKILTESQESFIVIRDNFIIKLNSLSLINLIKKLLLVTYC